MQAKELYQQLPDWVRPGSVVAHLNPTTGIFVFVQTAQPRPTRCDRPVFASRFLCSVFAFVCGAHSLGVSLGILVVNKPTSCATCTDPGRVL